MLTQEFLDFHRLATGLRAMKVDFDYAKTRLLLEPDWDGYGIPKGHDIIADDVDLCDANALTSRHRDSDLHRVVLDLDYGASLSRGNGLRKVRLFSANNYIGAWGFQSLQRILPGCTLDIETNVHQRTLGESTLVIKTWHDLVLIPSTTPGHHHLILDVNMPWPAYANLLYILEYNGIIEKGYRKVSTDREYSCIRVPWVKKQGKAPSDVSTPGERGGNNRRGPVLKGYF